MCGRGVRREVNLLRRTGNRCACPSIVRERAKTRGREQDARMARRWPPRKSIFHERVSPAATRGSSLIVLRTRGSPRHDRKIEYARPALVRWR